MKAVSIVTIFLILSGFCWGQGSADSIRIKKILGGYKFYIGTSKLNMEELKIVLESNAQAYQQLKSAQSANTVASIIGGIGGVLVGIPIGTAIAGKDANWALAGVGVGLIGVSIPFSVKANKLAKKAVNTYNSGLRSGSFWHRSELHLSIAGNKIGLTLQF